MMFNAIKRIHFVGIGGIGMSGIAEVLINSGYSVSGSDLKPTAVTERLASLGAKITLGHAAHAVEDAQVVVVSSAVNKHNPEILHAAQHRIPIIHRSEMLAELMRLKYGVIVAGTHGKTTTTSLLATALTAAGADPTIVIGGKLNSLDTNAKLGKGELFVAEADESDGSFLRLTPTIAVITNVDSDHLDHYQNFDAIVSAFHLFIEKVPFYGAICACIDDPGVQLLLPRMRRRLVTFGLRPDADITVRHLRADGFSMHFTPVIFGKEKSPVHLKMPGRYNVTNALASFAVASVLEFDLDTISHALSQFAGVLHRFTVLGTALNTTVIDDYAHNPKKIQVVLRGAREAFPEKHIIAIFQPHRYSRLKSLADEFARSFSDADTVIVTPVYEAGEQPIAGVTPQFIATQILIHSLNNSQGSLHVVESLADASAAAAQIARLCTEKSGALIITLGAGDVKNVGPLALEELKSMT